MAISLELGGRTYEARKRMTEIGGPETDEDYDQLSLLEEIEELARIALLEEGLARHPDSVRLLGRLARLLIRTDDVALRDPERAVELAERTVDLTDRDDHRLEALAMCLHAAGRLADAVEIAEEAAAKARCQHIKDLAEQYRIEFDGLRERE